MTHCLRKAALLATLAGITLGCAEFAEEIKKRADELSARVQSSQQPGQSQTQAPPTSPGTANSSGVSPGTGIASNPHLAALAQGPFGGLTIIELDDPAAISVIHPQNLKTRGGFTLV